MLVLGLILILVAAGALVVAVLGASGSPVEFTLGGFSISMEPLWVFLTGGATVLLLVLGVELIRAGGRRARKRRKEKKELDRLAKELKAREAGQGTGAAAAEPSTRSTDTRVTDTHGNGDVTGSDRPQS